MTTTPTVAQWQLARELQHLRQRHGLTITQVSKILEVTISTVSRWEAGQRLPREKELRQLTRHYELPGHEAEALLQLRHQAGRRGWWQSYDLDQSYGTFIGLEASASEIEAYNSTVITGLFQTEAYARSLIGALNGGVTDEEHERHMEVRRQRLAQVLSAEGPEIWVILGESAIRQNVGGAEVMREQLSHLQEMSAHPRVTLQVIPHTAGAHIGMVVPTFMILKLPESGLSTVYVEGYRSNLFLETAEDLADHEVIFNKLRLAGVGGNMLRRLLSESRKEF